MLKLFYTDWKKLVNFSLVLGGVIFDHLWLLAKQGKLFSLAETGFLQLQSYE